MAPFTEETFTLYSSHSGNMPNYMNQISG